MKFAKYHALGNDYIIIDPKEIKTELTQAHIGLICERHYGVGSDGLLVGPEKSDSCDFSVRIFNPDGSEAEKSGNGLRIFSRYLWDQNLVSHNQFTIHTKGGPVRAIVGEKGRSVSVGMGKVIFGHGSVVYSMAVPETIEINDQKYIYYAANIGNPHCVIILDEISDVLAKEIGSLIEKDARFPNRTNVQFVKVTDRASIKIEIWERGAGYTFASGSSSTAAASVVHSLGLCGPNVNVHMLGGVINIEIDKKYYVTMRGEVRKICEGTISNEM